MHEIFDANQTFFVRGVEKSAGFRLSQRGQGAGGLACGQLVICFARKAEFIGAVVGDAVLDFLVTVDPERRKREAAFALEAGGFAGVEGLAVLDDGLAAVVGQVGGLGAAEADGGAGRRVVGQAEGDLVDDGQAEAVGVEVEVVEAFDAAAGRVDLVAVAGRVGQVTGAFEVEKAGRVAKAAPLCGAKEAALAAALGLVGF